MGDDFDFSDVMKADNRDHASVDRTNSYGGKSSMDDIRPSSKKIENGRPRRATVMHAPTQISQLRETHNRRQSSDDVNSHFQNRRERGGRAQRRMSKSLCHLDSDEFSEDLTREIRADNRDHASVDRTKSHGRKSSMDDIRPSSKKIENGRPRRATVTNAPTQISQLRKTHNRRQSSDDVNSHFQNRRESGGRAQRRMSKSLCHLDSDEFNEDLTHENNPRKRSKSWQRLNRSLTSEKSSEDKYVSSRRGSNESNHHSRTIPLYKDTRGRQNSGPISHRRDSRSLTRKDSTESGQSYYTDDVQGRRVGSGRAQRRMSKSFSISDDIGSCRRLSLDFTPQHGSKIRSAPTSSRRHSMGQIDMAMKTLRGGVEEKDKGHRHTLTFAPKTSKSTDAENENTCSASATLFAPKRSGSMNTAVTSRSVNSSSSYEMKPLIDNDENDAHFRKKSDIDGSMAFGKSDSNDEEEDRSHFNPSFVTIDSTKSKSNRWYRNGRPRVILALIIAFIAALAATLVTLSLNGFIFGSESDANGENDVTFENSALSTPSSLPSLQPSPLYDPHSVLDPPPNDLEGRCSPSNLPGSKSICLESCKPAECCYLNDVDGHISGKMCFDTSPDSYNGILNNHRCGKYRPHCDIFFDSWDGADQGKIRPISANLEEVCRHRQREHTDIDNVGDVGNDDNLVSSRKSLRESSGFKLMGVNDAMLERDRNSDRNKHREHITDSAEGRGFIRGRSSESKNNNNRALNSGFQTCLQACLPSKCCVAHKITGNPTDSGFNIFQGGITMSMLTGDYVMLNCAKENKDSCDAYAKFCKDEYIEMAQLIESSEPPTVSPVLFVTTPPSFSAIALTPPTAASFSSPTHSPNSSSSLSHTTLSPSLSPSLLPSSSISEQASSLPSFSKSTSSTFPSTLLETYQPSSMPTHSFRPTISFLPVAPLSDINSACTGNINLIINGDANARKKCVDACSAGMCCLTDTPGMPAGLVDIPSCFNGNKDICSGYSGCLTLSLTSKDLSTNQQSQRPSTETSGIVTITAPPKPSYDLSVLCSAENRADPSGMLECFKECQKGSCCGGTNLMFDTDNSESDSGFGSCFDIYEDICALYGPCQAMADAYGGDGGPNSPLPPIPPKNLALLCSYDTLFEVKQSIDDNDESECESACNAASCCFDNSCPEPPNESLSAVEDTRKGRCDLYGPCQNLKQLPQPPSNIVDLCSSENSPSSDSSSQCHSVCAAAACCFPEYYSSVSDNSRNDVESCFALFKDTCLQYAPYCAAPPKVEGSVSVSVPLPPDDLSVCNESNQDKAACQSICKPSSCCFSSQPKENCFGSNEDVCGQWTICAKQIRPEKEVFDS